MNEIVNPAGTPGVNAATGNSATVTVAVAGALGPAVLVTISVTKYVPATAYV
jgi:hypothetical protein